MRKLARIVGTIGILATMALPAGKVSAQQSVEVAMEPQNGSGQSGKTTLYSEGNQTRVIIVLDNPAPGPEPAHIHVGSCPVPNATPEYPLSSVENGRSETVLNIQMGAILSQTMAVNVHRSPQEIPVYVSCGDIVLDDDFTSETSVDSVRENAREGTSDELQREKDKERNRR